MARVKIKDLPKDMKISADEMQRVKGGFTLSTNTLLFPKIETSVDGKITSVDGKIQDLKWENNLINPSLTHDKW